MYSNKQKLAMAMAATVVLSAVPAMSFAAPQDVLNVLAELKKEDPAETKKEAETNVKNYATATAALAAAKAVQGADADAMTIVAAYEASLKVLKSTAEADWTTARTEFAAAVAAMKAANPMTDFSLSFEHPNDAKKVGPEYMHQQVLNQIKGIMEIEGTFHLKLTGNEVRVDLPGPDLPSKVTLNGKDLPVDDPATPKIEGDVWMDVKGGNPNQLVVFVDDVLKAGITSLTFELGGKNYTVKLK